MAIERAFSSAKDSAESAPSHVQGSALRDSTNRAPTKTLASGARGHYVGGVQLQLLAFAQAADRLGFRERTIACEPTESPRALLARIAPAFATENLRAAVDREYRSWDAPLGEARELALIPPVSGG